MNDNKLLAEYLGLDTFTWKEIPGLRILPEDDMPAYIFEPNKDWNQLMMVVEKIEEESEDFIFEIYRNLDNVLGCKFGGRVGFGDTMIEAVYNVCVNYIKSRNEIPGNLS